MPFASTDVNQILLKTNNFNYNRQSSDERGRSLAEFRAGQNGQVPSVPGAASSFSATLSGVAR
jgi:hypothetical protein